MVITSELLAAYAAGNVSPAERLAVRQYLKAHPDRLQTVLIGMDDDYEIRLDRAEDPDAARYGADGPFAASARADDGAARMPYASCACYASCPPKAGTDDRDDGPDSFLDTVLGSDAAESASEMPFATASARAGCVIGIRPTAFASSFGACDADDGCDDCCDACFDENPDREEDAVAAESVENDVFTGKSTRFSSVLDRPTGFYASSVGTDDADVEDVEGDAGVEDDADSGRELERRLDELLDSMDWTQTRRRTLPLTAMAAEDRQNNLCAIRCEGIALRHFGFDVGDEELIEESRAEGWLRAEGTALHHIGKLSGRRGLNVAHRYDCSPGDILRALEQNQVVIAAVDGGELVGDLEWEMKEDALIGEIPDHAVVVTAIDSDTVTIIDPSTPQETDTYPISQFLDAWADSSRNLILIGSGDDYQPHPIDLSDIEISDDLLDLCEALAENAHEVWASDRIREGWTYGPDRDDCKRQHPDLLPYNRLDDSKRRCGREMAANTLRLLKKLGWDPVKR